MNRAMLLSLILLSCFVMPLQADKKQLFDLHGKIEHITNDDTATVLFHSDPERKEYLLRCGSRTVGTVTILQSWHQDSRTYPVKAYARLSFTDERRDPACGAGSLVVLPHAQRSDRKFDRPAYRERPEYQRVVTTPRDNREMVLVTGGKFYVGSNSAGPAEYPEHELEKDPFYIDRYEVSNGDYMRFVQQSGAPMPASWNGRYPGQKAQYPVLVSWYEAREYARWAGKRLPSEEEWEKAARGGKRWRYPWGETFDAERCNCAAFWKTNTTDERQPGLLPIKSFEEGASLFGAWQMSGNAAEWTSSWYQSYDGQREALPGGGTYYRVVRGGGWYSGEKECALYTRQRGGIPNLQKDRRFGFRCAMDVAPMYRSN